MGYTNFPKKVFIERTLANLKFIDDRKNRELGPYEFTQLINSFLLAFIHPKKYWITDFPENPLPAEGWNIKSIPVRGHEGCVPKTTRDLVVNIRHALAHGNFKILTTGEGPSADIDFVELWNTPHEDSETVIWRTSPVSVDDLAGLLRIVAKEMLAIADCDTPKSE